MIDIRKLKELVRLMVANDLSELDLRDSEEQVTLRRARGMEQSGVVQPAPAMAAPVSSAPPVAPEAPAPSPSGDESLHRIESPMVGTFYSAPSPDEPAFVKVGDQISADSVVCIVEAMKIFNEIKAECSGTVRKILAKNSEAVEFGQPLFLVEPE